MQDIKCHRVTSNRVTSFLTLFIAAQTISRTQDLPGANSLDVRPEFFEDITDVSLIMNAAEAFVATACPSGIKKCECMNAPGTEISILLSFEISGKI